MEPVFPSPFEQFLCRIADHCGIAAPSECELLRVSYAVAQAVPVAGGRSRFPLGVTVGVEPAYRKARLGSMMHADRPISGPLVRLALALRASKVEDARADELCDLYTIAVRALGAVPAA